MPLRQLHGYIVTDWDHYHPPHNQARPSGLHTDLSKCTLLHGVRGLGEVILLQGVFYCPWGLGWAHTPEEQYGQLPQICGRRRPPALMPAGDTPKDNSNTQANLKCLYTRLYNAPKTHTNTKQQGGTSIHVFYGGSVYRLLYVGGEVVGTLVCVVRVWLPCITCLQAATAKPTPCDALRAGVCLHTPALGVRTSVFFCLWACIAVLCVHMICIRIMAPRWRVSSEVRLLLYG